MIAQRKIAAKSNEIPAFAPLLNRIASRGVAVTTVALDVDNQGPGVLPWMSGS
ncbi:hypothetical protein ACFWBB_20545 [Streptomyces sp. NPDC060000]|uniref:hypothetical protein n=1 Tax=Streptomyces sp. NPDC060000 TaxID=3347031 RepID=UPI00369D2504